MKTNIQNLKKTQESLNKRGYAPLIPGMMPKSHTDNSVIREKDDWHDTVSSLLTGSKCSGDKERGMAPTQFASSGNEQQVPDGIGSKGLGFIEWGAGNNWPNVVALLTQMMHVTASGWKWNTDLLCGLGPRPMYRYVRYIGGNVSTDYIPYEDAGPLLQGLITDKQREIANASSPSSDGVSTPSSSSSSDSVSTPSYNSPLIQSLSDQLSTLQQQYATWQSTYIGDKGKEQYSLKSFLRRTNLQQVYASLSGDMTMFGIAFPELRLNEHEIGKNGMPVKTSEWHPHVTSIAPRMATVCRLERMDENGRINNVYVSNQWLDPTLVDKQDPKNNKIIAYPCLSPVSPYDDLSNIILSARQRNVSSRPTRVILPSYYPTPGKPYYPSVPWHSIFGGKIYEYLSTIISDRATRKANSNIIGRIIYVHQEYMQSLFASHDATADAVKQQQISDKVYDDIDSWLSNRNNAGTSLLSYTFVGSDGKEHKAWEIVEIESNNKNATAANEKETAEVTSIVAMAMGIDLPLLGSSPLTLASSSGGTDLRERREIRQSQMATTEQILLSALNVTRDINQWDPLLTWQVKRYSLTTLDNSKTGLVESTTE